MIPIIDFSLFNTHFEECAQKVFDAARTSGFFYLSNTDITPSSVDSMFEKSRELFKLPDDVKSEYAIDTQVNLGYSSIRQEATDPQNYQQGDFKESFNISKLNGSHTDQPLPHVLTKDKDELKDFIQGCHAIVGKVLICLGAALKIPESKGGKMWFYNRHLYEDPSGDLLRLLHYPPLAHSTETDDIRIGRHSDYGSITLLFQNKVGGLEVEKEDGSWLDAPALDGCITVNLGDCLEYWTGGLLRSTKHRVVFRPETQTKPRYSMAYFCQGGQTVLEPVPSEYVPNKASDSKCITAADHLQYKINNTYKY
ncbi:hypothetical protein BDF14DRAFT_1779155 [Spinellus fusiger]|nr:hypothetical protein BDF14DRAFT_1779155 [Spinellus fusiger]